MQPWLAVESGAFLQKGLAVDLKLVDSSAGVPALLSGEVQVAEVGGSEIVSAIAGGADLVIVATCAPTYPYVMEVATAIKSKDDLKGKTIGVSRFGSSSDTATRASLKKYGLDPEKDVSIIQVGSASSRVAAMKSGQIQGGLAQPPDTLTVEAQGFHPLYDVAGLGLASANTVVVASRPWLNSHHQEMQNYMDAFVTATAKARTDKAFAETVLKKYLKTDDQTQLDVTYDYFMTKIIQPLPYAKPEQFQDIVNQLAVQNPKVKSVDFSKAIDSSFVKSTEDRHLQG